MKRKVPGCSGKVRRPDIGRAVAAVKRINNAQLSVYQCRHCHGWHLGRNRHPMKIQARLDQLIGPDPKAKPMEKKRTSVGTLRVGDWCYPQSERPSASFLRTKWQVAKIEDDRTYLLKLGRQCRFLAPHRAVLIDAPAS